MLVVGQCFLFVVCVLFATYCCDVLVVRCLSFVDVFVVRRLSFVVWCVLRACCLLCVFCLMVVV